MGDFGTETRGAPNMHRSFRVGVAADTRKALDIFNH
jgi:hypothetical protein